MCGSFPRFRSGPIPLQPRSAKIRESDIVYILFEVQHGHKAELLRLHRYICDVFSRARSMRLGL